MSGKGPEISSDVLYSDSEQFEAIFKRLDLIICLRLLILQKEHQFTQRELIDLLDVMSFRPIEIAKFLRTTPNTVSVALNKIRKERT